MRVRGVTSAVVRARVVRELHDAVTHQVTAMVVQAEAARHLTAAPDRLDAALAAVADTGRRAVADLRLILDLLPADPDAQGRTPLPAGARPRTEDGDGPPVQVVITYPKMGDP